MQARGIIPQQDGKRRRSQAEGLPCLPAGRPVSLCAWGCHQGSLAIPRNFTGGLLVILSRFKGGLAGWREGDRRVGKQEAWQTEGRALLG